MIDHGVFPNVKPFFTLFGRARLFDSSSRRGRAGRHPAQRTLQSFLSAGGFLSGTDWTTDLIRTGQMDGDGLGDPNRSTGYFWTRQALPRTEGVCPELSILLSIFSPTLSCQSATRTGPRGHGDDESSKQWNVISISR